MIRDEMLRTAKEYMCIWEGQKKHHEIVDTFNKVKPDGWAMTYSAPWCACSVSAWAIMTVGVTKAKKYFPLSANCGVIIDKAKKMGIWKEADNYRPKKGDWILYDWDDSGYGDNHGSPDHVGLVDSVKATSIVVVEGNKSSRTTSAGIVGVRVVPVNGRFIRGFVTPKYDDMEPKKTTKKKSTTAIAKEVIAGKWGNGDERKKRLKAAGYDYAEVQKKVNALVKKKESK